MKTNRLPVIFGIGCLFIVLGLGSPTSVLADVAPGDVIDRTNWQKAEGLLPVPVLNWVKNGDFILNIGELTYDLNEYVLCPSYRKSLIDNIGKYDLNEEDVIVDAKTGKYPEVIEGIPFPNVDLNDPRAGTKLMYNKEYCWVQWGSAKVSSHAIWVGASGYERKVGNSMVYIAMDGHPGAKSLENEDGMFRRSVLAVDYPFDVAGFSLLLWRYKDNRQDVTFAYVPAIRRTRRMTPANRSNAYMGSDICVDDVYGYDGKVPLFTWKVIGQQEALSVYRDVKPPKLVRTEKGSYDTTADITPVVYGYERAGWQGAPWAPVEAVWVKNPMILIEGTAKDPYYNYGKQILWYDPAFYAPKFKVIYDRAGKYWKSMFIGYDGLGTEDGSYRQPGVSLQGAVDDRTRHATVIQAATAENIQRFHVQVEMADFTMAGFYKYCK
jgi:hypothetical protein